MKFFMQSKSALFAKYFCLFFALFFLLGNLSCTQNAQDNKGIKAKEIHDTIKNEDTNAEEKLVNDVAKNGSMEEKPLSETEKTFGDDVAFLQKYVKSIVLKDNSGEGQIVVVPAYQGRVMTSSATGETGTSFGWINYAHIAAGKVAEQINVYGGEERFWIGPEGGQFSIFFKPGAKFEFADWGTPAFIDTEPFEVTKKNESSVSFRKETTFQNFSKTEFNIRIDRTIEVLSNKAAAKSLGAELTSLKFVGYKTTNSITNTGEKAWTKETGLLSIWMLGMYKPGAKTTVVIPFQTGKAAELGPIVNDTYFGKVPADRLKVDAKKGVLYFSGDGAHRSKIGLTPKRSKDICGSYDAARKVLTIVKYTKPAADVTDYVNSMWEHQEKPFAGDAVNSYNDGPAEPGAKPLGPFYELETSSPALALEPNATGKHIQETYHFSGTQEALDRLSQRLLGVSLEEISGALE